MRANLFKIAAVQLRSTFGNVEGNLSRMTPLVELAARKGANVVVTPEASIPGYASDDLRTIWHTVGRDVDPWFKRRDVLAVAERIPGPTANRLAEVARESTVWLLGGIIELGEDDLIYNTAILLSPSGDLAAKHRKRWPWPAIEPAWATPGNTPAVVCQTEFGRLGIAICYDIHRVRRLYQPRDVDTLLFPAAWVDRVPAAAYLDRRFPLVARTLGCNLVFANRCMSPQNPWFGSGESTIYGADGSILARSSEQYRDDVVIAEVPISDRSGQ